MFEITSRRPWWYLLSLSFLLPGIIALLTGGLKPGIDFTGGSLLHLRFEQPIQQQFIQDIAAESGYPRATVQLTDLNGVLIRIETIDSEKKSILVDALFQRAGTGQELSFSSIGPVVGSELTRHTHTSLTARQKVTNQRSPPVSSPAYSSR